MKSLVKDEEGSVLPLILGYLLLALALVLVCTCATDLYIAQKRLDTLADAAALAGTDGFVVLADGASVRTELTDAGVREQAQAMVDTMPAEAVLTAASAADGVTARVTVETVWRPPMLALFVPDGVPIAATATSRTALGQ